MIKWELVKNKGTYRDIVSGEYGNPKEGDTIVLPNGRSIEVQKKEYEGLLSNINNVFTDIPSEDTTVEMYLRNSVHEWRASNYQGDILIHSRNESYQYMDTNTYVSNPSEILQGDYNVSIEIMEDTSPTRAYYNTPYTLEELERLYNQAENEG